MTQNKRSPGVILFALAIIIFGVIGLLAVVFIQSQRPRYPHIIIIGSINLLKILCGIGIIMLKDIARKATIFLFGFSVLWQLISLLLISNDQWISILAAFPQGHNISMQTLKILTISLAMLFPVIWFAIVSFFLTREKVKEQFE